VTVGCSLVNKLDGVGDVNWLESLKERKVYMNEGSL
jgi:hypothetical protein